MTRPFLRTFFVLLLTITIQGVCRAQHDTAMAPQKHTSGLRISLITCGPGYNEIYEVFGHTAVRIIDSQDKTDLVYNYGTFNGFEENFELKFMRGKLPYYLSVYPFRDFVPEYIQTRRSVAEQVLDLNDGQKEAIQQYLDVNAEPENRQYKYDFFYDNCATRIRDIFPNSIGKDFKYHPILPAGSKETFRDIINRYFYATKWERFGINILLGSKIDKVMTDKDVMFLPDYLSLGVKNATVNNRAMAEKPVIMLEGGPAAPDNVSGPMVLTMAICVLTVAGLSVKRLKLLGRIMTISLMLITGLLGCLIIIMWFFTDHQGCSNNFNILWLLPTNIILAFGRPRGSGRYAVVAILLVFATILLHILRVQQLIMIEFMPLLLALLYIYGTIYRNSRTKALSS